MNFSLSTNLNASWLKIGQYGTRFRILISNFGDPLELIFQNLIGGPSMLQTLYVGEILYNITCQSDDSTKNSKKCILVSPIEVSRPSFKHEDPSLKIWNLLNQVVK
jgi:hypothetical protein